MEVTTEAMDFTSTGPTSGNFSKTVEIFDESETIVRAFDTFNSSLTLRPNQSILETHQTTARVMSAVGFWSSLLLSVSGTALNGLVLVIIARHRSLWNVHSLLLANLLVTDLLHCAVKLPLVVVSYHYRSWVLPANSCTVFGYLVLELTGASNIAMIVVTLHCYIKVVHPTVSVRVFTVNSCIAMVIIGWIVCAIILMPAVTGMVPATVGWNPELLVCGILRGQTSLVYLGVLLLTGQGPALVMACCFSRIFCVIRNQERRINAEIMAMDRSQAPDRANVTARETEKKNVSHTEVTQLAPSSNTAGSGNPGVETQGQIDLDVPAQNATLKVNGKGLTADVTDTSEVDRTNNMVTNNDVTTTNPSTTNGMAPSTSAATTSNTGTATHTQGARKQKTNKKKQKHQKKKDRQFLKIALSLYLLFLCTTLPFALVNLADGRVKYPWAHHVVILLSMSLAPANALVYLLRHGAIRRYVFGDRFEGSL